MVLSVCVSVCLCVCPPSHKYTLVALIFAVKVMRCIQCSLVFLIFTMKRWRGVVVNVLVVISEVTLRRARLELGTWMDDRLRTGEPSRYVSSHPG